jgi:hypothetical protein
MKSLSCAFATALLVVGAGIGMSAPASARCLGISGTADGFDFQTAIDRSASAVEESVGDLKAKYKVHHVSLSPMKMKPEPYWRDSVPKDAYVKPDIVTSKTHTVCWHGVISPYVCTAGARACF